MTWVEKPGGVHERQFNGESIAFVRPWIGGQYKCCVRPSPSVCIEALKPRIDEGKAWCIKMLEGRIPQ